LSFVCLLSFQKQCVLDLEELNPVFYAPVAVGLSTLPYFFVTLDTALPMLREKREGGKKGRGGNV